MRIPKLRKEISILAMSLISSLHCSWSQTPDDFSTDDVVSIKTPDVAAIESVNFLPVNEYTGRINVDIPIYTIDLDGLSIPISISYNSGGVKVNTIASRVGLNWSLNAGGIISREIKGKDDLTKKYETVENDVVYSEYGFLIENYSSPNHTIWNPGRDGIPDHFFVSAPGLNTIFTHKSNAEPMELNPAGNKIETTVVFRYQGGSGLYYKFDEFDITSSSGFKYNFKDKENSFGHYSIYDVPHNDPIHVPFDGKFTSIYSTSIHLSSIASPISDRTVTFTYDDLTVNDHDLYTESKYKNDGTFVGHTDYDEDSLEVKIIKTITFDSGVIDFYYTTGRLDLAGDQRLTRIDVRNNHNKLIKRVHFVQSYFPSSEGCTDPECYRLRLDEIYFEDISGTDLPGYKFTYNSTHDLPNRRSYKQDFMGYYNGTSSSSSTSFRPKIYYKADQGRNSIIPFNITGQGYVANSNTYSLESDLVYAKAASLEKIEYPTGGYATIEYELNEFKFLGQEISGGGLRIKDHKLYDQDDTLERHISYEYKKSDNTSSGSILFTPLWGNFKNEVGSNALEVYQRSLNGYELTKNSYVGYSRVKISETGNGYVIKSFTAPSDTPNTYPSSFTYYVGSPPYSTTRQNWLDFRKDNGTFPNLWQTNEIQRGNLLSAETYDNSNTLLKKVVNEYTYMSFENIGTYDNLFYPDGYTYYDDPFYLRAHSEIRSERHYLDKSTSTTYYDNGDYVVESNYLFSTDKAKPFIMEKSIIANSGDVMKEEFFYPYDSEVAGVTGVSGLVTNNMIDKPIKTKSYNDTDLLSTTLSKYKDWGGGTYLPEFGQGAKSVETLEDRIIYHDYDNKGNPIEISQADGKHICYVWGYDQEYPIAKIENATYSDFSSQVANLQSLSDLDNDRTQGLLGKEGDLRDAQTTLRNLAALAEANVTTYTYDPLIGITSVTDPRGYTMYYEYDNFNRLIRVIDNDGNIVSENNYHYKNQ